MRTLPASLRAILLDPEAAADRAAGVRVLPWESDGESAFPRWRTYAHREGRAVTALVVTTVTENCHVAVVRRGRGRAGRPRHFSTLSAAMAAAETAAVAHALRPRSRAVA